MKKMRAAGEVEMEMPRPFQGRFSGEGSVTQGGSSQGGALSAYPGLWDATPSGSKAGRIELAGKGGAMRIFEGFGAPTPTGSKGIGKIGMGTRGAMANGACGIGDKEIGVKEIGTRGIGMIGKAAAAAITALLFAGAGEARAQGPTFYKDILPVFQKHCIACHHTGGSAPQSLETYKKARPWLRSSKKTMQDGTMPPWHADPAVGKWKNYEPVTAAEIELIAKWVDDGSAEGTEAEGPKALDFSKPWKLGEPAKTLKMAEPFTVPAEGGDVYRAFVLGPEFAEDTWLSAIELKPGTMDVVADMWVSAVPAAAAKAADDADPAPGFKAFDGGWEGGAKEYLAVWNKGLSHYSTAPEGAGILVPKGSSLVLYVHYATLGEEEKDQSEVGLYPAAAPAAKALQTAVIENRKVEAPANATAHQQKAELKLEKAVKIHSIVPRMHYLGTALELVAHSPDGKATPILKVKDYNYKLMSNFVPAEAIALPAGTRLEATATYDNSTDNPNNPNMTVKAAGYGPAPEGEVLSVVVQYTEE